METRPVGSLPESIRWRHLATAVPELSLDPRPARGIELSAILFDSTNNLPASFMGNRFYFSALKFFSNRLLTMRHTSLERDFPYLFVF
jgi:hypothetical protein